MRFRWRAPIFGLSRVPAPLHVQHADDAPKPGKAGVGAVAEASSWGSEAESSIAMLHNQGKH